MCLALPAGVVAIDPTSDLATIALGEIRKEVSVAVVDAVQVDDYVLVHLGYALNKISQDEARRTLAQFAEAGLRTRGDP